MDQGSFEFIQNEQPKLSRNEADNIVSSVNRTLHREGIRNARIERIRCTDSRRLLGVTASTSTLQDLLERRDTVLRAARLNSCITGLAPQQSWKWIRIHNISLTRYLGKVRDDGLVKLREELEAENGGVHIPAEIRWLGGAKVRARFQEKKDGTTSVVAAVLGEATFHRLCKGGVRLLGRRYEVDAFEEAWRPGAPFARRTTSRPTTDAPSRGARWVRATHAHTGWPGVQIAGVPTGRGRMHVLFSFSLPDGRGGKEIGWPRYNAHGIGDRIWLVCFKGGKMGALSVRAAASRCHSPSGCM